MPQETSIEFSRRFQQAIDGHPSAPPTPFGRQRWLLEKLKRETGLEVSPNAVHKWTHGTSRPREDTIRKIATVLSVDPVWLSQGRRTVADVAATREEAIRGRGATLFFAGLIEMAGGRVTFPGADDPVTHLWVDFGRGSKGVTVATEQTAGTTISYFIPEPIGDNRIVSIRARPAGPGDDHTGTYEVIDLTDVPRRNLGGFSVIQGELQPGNRLRVEGHKTILAPVPTLVNLIG